MRDIRRVFQYHGAEHKSIAAYENGVELTPETAQQFSTAHVRCGTNFLLIVMVVAIVVYSVIPRPNLLVVIGSRVVLIPLIAGLSYEVIRLAARNMNRAVVRAMMRPGLLLQRLTQLNDRFLCEFAAKAVKEVAYHRELASEWAVRLGDGTEESARRMAEGLDWCWRFVPELFEVEGGVEAGLHRPRRAVQAARDGFQQQQVPPGETIERMRSSAPTGSRRWSRSAPQKLRLTQ